MVSVFDENYDWTDRAMKVSRIASEKIKEIFDEFPDVSPREISHIIMVDAGMEECCRIIDLKSKLEK